MKLPKHGIMDTVRTVGEIQEHPTFRWFSRCRHLETTAFVWIDHRAGPGGYADTWEGQVCKDCREIVEKRGINGTQ